MRIRRRPISIYVAQNWRFTFDNCNICFRSPGVLKVFSESGTFTGPARRRMHSLATLSRVGMVGGFVASKMPNG